LGKDTLVSQERHKLIENLCGFVHGNGSICPWKI